MMMRLGKRVTDWLTLRVELLNSGFSSSSSTFPAVGTFRCSHGFAFQVFPKTSELSVYRELAGNVSGMDEREFSLAHWKVQFVRFVCVARFHSFCKHLFVLSFLRNTVNNCPQCGSIHVCDINQSLFILMTFICVFLSFLFLHLRNRRYF